MLAVVINSNVLTGPWFWTFTAVCVGAIGLALLLERKDKARLFSLFALLLTLCAASGQSQVINCDYFPYSIECWWWFGSAPNYQPVTSWEHEQTFNPAF